MRSRIVLPQESRSPHRTATDERRKSVDFSISYFDNEQVLLAIKPPSEGAQQNVTKLRSPDDLADKKIGVLMGSADSPFAHEHFPRANILEFQSAPDEGTPAARGEADKVLASFPGQGRKKATRPPSKWELTPRASRIWPVPWRSLRTPNIPSS